MVYNSSVYRLWVHLVTARHVHVVNLIASFVMYRLQANWPASLLIQVTKPRYFHKPTYDTLRSSLLALHEHCHGNGVTELCLPRIGCGLDKLQWDRVSRMIREIFADSAMTITVYYL